MTLKGWRSQGLIVLALGLLILVNNQLPRSAAPQATFDATGIRISRRLQGDPVRAQAVLLHEMLHALKQNGGVRQDIPTAFALEVVAARVREDPLGNVRWQWAFDRGRADVSPSQEVNAIMARHAGKRETPASYEDGAYLAGVTVRLFGDDEGASFRYILLLSRGLQASVAQTAAVDLTKYEALTGLKLQVPNQNSQSQSILGALPEPAVQSADGGTP